MMIDVSRGGAVWSARVAHNHKVAGSNPAPATKKDFSETGRSFLFILNLSLLFSRLHTLAIPAKEEVHPLLKITFLRLCSRRHRGALS